MKLIDLNPRFVGAGGEGITDKDDNPVPHREGVGVSFDCPCGKCGTRCFIAFSNPISGGSPYEPGHPVWERTGETFETMTLTPSIQRVGGCAWHGFITNGETVGV